MNSLERAGTDAAIYNGKERELMTNKQVFDAIRKMGMAVSLNDGEWRVDYKRDDSRRSLDSCYFTNDKTDAIQTAEVMSTWNKPFNG